MSIHWKPGKTTVQLDAGPRPSRIRRDPVRINANAPAERRRPANLRELELYGGVAGVLVFAAAIATAIIALAMFTVLRDDPAEDARIAQFTQCYNAQGPNCVADGGSITVAGQRVEIAGVDAPGIADAKCDREHDRGVEAATVLAELLNSGAVTVGAPFRDQSGRTVSKVEVKGRDVALNMIGQDLAHEPNSGLSWCR